MKKHIAIGKNGQPYSPECLLIDGNMGIGTTSPKNKFDVNENIRAKEFKVKPAFIFKPSYKLKPLCEVEQYINTNGHLPEIPSV